MRDISALFEKCKTILSPVNPLYEVLSNDFHRDSDDEGVYRKSIFTQLPNREFVWGGWEITGDGIGLVITNFPSFPRVIGSEELAPKVYVLIIYAFGDAPREAVF